MYLQVKLPYVIRVLIACYRQAFHSALVLCAHSTPQFTAALVSLPLVVCREDVDIVAATVEAAGAALLPAGVRPPPFFQKASNILNHRREISANNGGQRL